MKWNLLVVLVGLMTGLAPALSDAQDARVGWIGPLTGNAAVLGVDTVPAMQIVFDAVNDTGGVDGHRIILNAQDDQYVANKTVAAYEMLVRKEGVKVIIVLTYGGLFALADRAQKDDVLLIDPLDCDEEIAKLPENVLCITKMTEDLGAANADRLLRIDAFPAGILHYDGDPFMGIASQATERRLKSKGHGWDFVATYSENTLDFRSVLVRAKAAGLKSLFFYGYDQMGTAMKEARALGITAQFFTMAVSTSPDFQKLAGPSLSGAYFPVWEAPRGERFAQFSKSFAARAGRAPHMEISTVPSYDIAELIVQGLRSGALSPKGQILVGELRRYFYAVKDYEGVSGKITVDPDGVTRSFRVSEKVWSNGQILSVPQ